ncbi:SseB family protein [Georgenia alba]|uniref:SseB family protein n=1 Tax=Georgenia alba TaxID=2233858 RepID=A0ABW2Q8J3_9MICO
MTGTDSAGRPWAGRNLTSHPFAGDDGAVRPEMAEALAKPWPEQVVAVVDALRSTRVIVPVVAHEHPGTDPDGHVRAHAAEKFRTGDRSGDAMASASLVSVRTPDGRAAVPVFSCVQTLATWDAAARPVPVEGVRAALSAVQDADSLLVLDPGNDVTVLVPRPAVWAVARQQPWTPSWADPELPDLAVEALRGITELVGVRLEPGERAELRVRLAVRAGLDADTLHDAMARASRALGEHPVLRERVDSLELAPTRVEAT